MQLYQTLHATSYIFLLFREILERWDHQDPMERMEREWVSLLLYFSSRGLMELTWIVIVSDVKSSAGSYMCQHLCCDDERDSAGDSREDCRIAESFLACFPREMLEMLGLEDFQVNLWVFPSVHHTLHAKCKCSSLYFFPLLLSRGLVGYWGQKVPQELPDLQ